MDPTTANFGHCSGRAAFDVVTLPPWCAAVVRAIYFDVAQRMADPVIGLYCCRRYLIWVKRVLMEEGREEADNMEPDLLNLYGRASKWTGGKVRGAVTKLDAPTTCEQWDVRSLLNHMLQTQLYFLGAARGHDVALSQDPPDLISDDPPSDFDQVRAEMLRTYSAAGTVEKTGQALGIAFSDQLLHGWDLAVSTEQDATMPEGLPEAAYAMIHGRFTDEQRRGVFKPEIVLTADLSAQQRLLAYTGRDPFWRG
jgi:uncharacterized protein (TIGR03086 family)